MDKPVNCPEFEKSGICSKGISCEICGSSKSKITLNLDATEYVPKKKQQNQNQPQQQSTTQQKEEPKSLEPVEKLKLNLEAKAYEPKTVVVPQGSNNNDAEEEDDYDFDEEDVYTKEVEVIVKDMIENEEVEDDESDEDKWFPKFKDCECCQGFVYKCNGETCKNMLSCYCKVKAECDDY